ncbi:ABC transporter permease [Algihabitans albus]|uniref:ABC transporter permease n=1 Tax=Algihabitans albus TaxID=2164067 RepID=UPI000E5D73C0|nr:ABC transporter permease [Algihabitans albus]
MIGVWGIRLFMGAIGLVLVAPLVVIAGVALNEGRVLYFPPRGFSLQWFAEILRDDGWSNALLNSLSIALLSATLAVSIALPLAYFLWRWRVRYAAALYTLGTAPFVLPPVISALGFLAFWATVGLYGDFVTVVISHAIFFVTLPMVTISLGFQSIDLRLVEAAATMGATPGQIFRSVIFPLVRPYIVSGFAFAFVLSLNEYIVAYMVAGFTVETLPIKIFNSLRYGYTPVMAAVAVVFVAVALLVFGLIARFGNLPRLLGALQGRET